MGETSVKSVTGQHHQEAAVRHRVVVYNTLAHFGWAWGIAGRHCSTGTCSAAAAVCPRAGRTQDRWVRQPLRYRLGPALQTLNYALHSKDWSCRTFSLFPTLSVAWQKTDLFLHESLDLSCLGSLRGCWCKPQTFCRTSACLFQNFSWKEQGLMPKSSHLYHNTGSSCNICTWNH